VFARDDAADMDCECDCEREEWCDSCDALSRPDGGSTDREKDLGVSEAGSTTDPAWCSEELGGPTCCR